MRSIHTIAQAREGEERGRGVPLTDIERACRHYGISPDQYLACPECYPLPERGAGLIAALPEGNWQLVKSGTTLEGQFYIGQAEQCTFEFSFLPEQLPGVQTVAEQIASALRSALEEQGHTLLSYKLYLDKAEWYRSRWLCIATAHGSPAINWVVIIGVLLLIAAIVGLIAWLVHEVKNLPYFGPAIILIGIGVAAGGVAALLKRGEK